MALDRERRGVRRDDRTGARQPLAGSPHLLLDGEVSTIASTTKSALSSVSSSVGCRERAAAHLRRAARRFTFCPTAGGASERGGERLGADVLMRTGSRPCPRPARRCCRPSLPAQHGRPPDRRAGRLRPPSSRFDQPEDVDQVLGLRHRERADRLGFGVEAGRFAAGEAGPTSSAASGAG
jgi:hypothetical protein